MNAHSELVNQIISTHSRNGTRLFKNPCGKYKVKDGYWIEYGLHTGSSDIIGFTTVTVTQGMVGSRIAVFVGIEVKTGLATRSKAQRAWNSILELFGARTGTARSLEDARKIIVDGTGN